MTAQPARRRKKPFTPGTGHAPEHVVGREDVFDVLEDALQSIAPSEVQEEDALLEHDAMPPIVLTGPRGVGKTLLLRWMQKRAQEMGIHVARLEYVKDLAPGDALGNLFDEIAGGDESLLKLVKGFNLSVGPLGGGVDLGAATRTYKNVLQSRLSQGPVALLMDEAHHYEAKYMGIMLQVGQRLINEEYPLVMLLVGTPDLQSYLMKIEATFMTRSEDIYINLLATDESKKALSKPFADRRIAVEPEALEMMWGMTDNYPYFVQIVGAEVWKVLSKGRKRRIDVALVEQAQAAINRKRRNFYRKIYNEMNAKELTPYALQAAEVLAQQPNAQAKRKDIELVLQKKNRKLKAAKARDIVDGLQWLGFIWQGDEDYMEAGIPSFFTYLHEMEQDTLKR